MSREEEKKEHFDASHALKVEEERRGCCTRCINEIDPVVFPEEADGGRVDSDASFPFLRRVSLSL